MIMWSALSSKELEHGGNTPNNLATQELFELETRLIKHSAAMSYQIRIDKNHLEMSGSAVRSIAESN